MEIVIIDGEEMTAKQAQDLATRKHHRMED